MRRSATSKLQLRFASFLRRSRSFVPGESLGVAVSGGADSVALLRLLLAVQSEIGASLRVLHFHHSLRGAEADADADFVASLARAHDLEFICDRRDVAAAAKQNRWNLEDAARRLRYSFFESVAAAGRVSRVAVAHTAEDQAETLLSHMIRGTGLRGLAGIHPVSGCVVRPLLNFRRGELRGYLQSLGQPWREDSSNFDTQRTRARIRARMLPVLEAEFSSASVDHLCNLARLAREDEIFWDAVVDTCFHRLARPSSEGVAIPARDLLSPSLLSFLAPAGGNLDSPAPALLRPLTERLVRRLYEQARGGRAALGAVHVEQVISLASGSSSGRALHLPGGVKVEKNFAELCFYTCPVRAGSATKTVFQSGSYQYAVALPGRGETFVSVPEIGARFKLKVIDWPLPERETKMHAVALDADLLRTPLVLRNWRPGDAYRPCGRRQSKKLKQLFLARRVPVRQRASWPVLESAGRVVWAWRFPPAAEFGIGRQTRAGVLIEGSQARGT
ncbi:MAG TPA: tRNA lysidine(34) synthetase TilS [Verrucomicrobiae bacterium]|nr:tRNA lysidine(34) synthetase TilS [Verrucomicrobiae bacterium]